MQTTNNVVYLDEVYPNHEWPIQAIVQRVLEVHTNGENADPFITTLPMQYLLCQFQLELQRQAELMDLEFDEGA